MKIYYLSGTNAAKYGLIHCAQAECIKTVIQSNTEHYKLTWCNLSIWYTSKDIGKWNWTTLSCALSPPLLLNIYVHKWNKKVIGLGKIYTHLKQSSYRNLFYIFVCFLNIQGQANDQVVSALTMSGVNTLTALLFISMIQDRWCSSGSSSFRFQKYKNIHLYLWNNFLLAVDQISNRYSYTRVNLMQVRKFACGFQCCTSDPLIECEASVCWHLCIVIFIKSHDNYSCTTG